MPEPKAQHTAKFESVMGECQVRASQVGLNTSCTQELEEHIKYSRTII